MYQIEEQYRKKYEEVTEEMKTLGREMGWISYDDNDPEGLFGPILREMFGESSELELKRIHAHPDAKKSLEFYRLFVKWRKLRELYSLVEFKNEKGGLISREKRDICSIN